VLSPFDPALVAVVGVALVAVEVGFVLCSV